MSRTVIKIRCLACDQPGIHSGRGLCEACYSHHHKNRTLDQYPPVRGNAEWQATRRLDAVTPLPTDTPTPVSDDSSWEAYAACRDHDPELFFPLTETTSSPLVEEAKQVCTSCPVRPDCHDWVTANPQEYGIWAGLTSKERRRLRILERSPA